MTYFARKTRQLVSPRRRTTRPRLEPLEGRQLLSGFGPEDGAYIVEPVKGMYSNVIIQPGDQKILATGVLPIVSPTPPGTPVFGVARYDSSGNPDLTYGTGGLATPTVGPLQYSHALTVQPDGKAVVAGTVTMNGKIWGGIAVARLGTDGSADASFGSGGWTGFDVQSSWDEAYAVGLQSSGKIVVAGYSRNYYSRSLVARFTTAGAIDAGTGGFGQLTSSGKPAGYITSSFGGNYQTFNDLVVQPDDKIVAAGFVERSDGHYAAIVARYSASGSLDKTFNSKGSTKGYFVLASTGFDISAQGVALQADGKIVVTGQYPGIDGRGDLLVARFNTNGTLDRGFGGGAGFVRLDVDGTASMTAERGKDVVIQPDGKIVVVGTVDPQVIDVTGGSVLVARFNTNGTPDASFGNNGIKLGTAPAGTGWHYWDGRSVALMADGAIIVAGHDNWANNGDSINPLLMRFLPTTASASQSAVNTTLASSAVSVQTSAQGQPLLAEAVASLRIAEAGVSRSGSFSRAITLDVNAPDWGWSVVHSSRRGRVPQPAAWSGPRS